MALLAVYRPFGKVGRLLGRGSMRSGMTTPKSLYPPVYDRWRGQEEHLPPWSSICSRGWLVSGVSVPPGRSYLEVPRPPLVPPPPCSHKRAAPGTGVLSCFNGLLWIEDGGRTKVKPAFIPKTCANTRIPAWARDDGSDERRTSTGELCGRPPRDSPGQVSLWLGREFSTEQDGPRAGIPFHSAHPSEHYYPAWGPL